MTTYSQGQVVLIPFPFSDLTTTKQCPAKPFGRCIHYAFLR